MVPCTVETIEPMVRAALDGKSVQIARVPGVWNDIRGDKMDVIQRVIEAARGEMFLIRVKPEGRVQ